MNPMGLLERARSLAYLAHLGQVNDKSGEDYILHPERVASYVVRAIGLLEDHSWAGHDPSPVGRYGSARSDFRAQAMAIAWLHDTIEDTWVDEVILDRVFFDHPEITPAVVALSRGGHQSNPHLGRNYYQVVSEQPLTLVVKLADLMDNGDPHRLEQIEDEATRTRLIEKYDYAAESMGVREEYEAWQTRRREKTTLGGPLKQPTST